MKNFLVARSAHWEVAGDASSPRLAHPAPEHAAPPAEMQENPFAKADRSPAQGELCLLSATQWDRLSAGFDDLVIEQTGTFCAARWGSSKTECVGFRVNGEIVAGAAAMVTKAPFLGTGIAIIKWGPQFVTAGQQLSRDLLTSFLRAMVREFCEERGLHLTIFPVASPETSEVIVDCLSEVGFSEGPKLAAPLRYLVNTDCTPDQLSGSLDQKWRYNLRKAKQKDLKIGFDNTEDGIHIFMDLYKQMYTRKGFLDSSGIATLPTLFRDLPDGIRPEIVIVRHEDEVVAGGVFFLGAGMASYMFGATSDRALSLNAGYAMHWWIAEDLCRDPRVKWLDLGGNDLDEGLHRYKKGMVGKAGLIIENPPRFHFASSLRGRLFGAAVFRLRDLHAAVKRRIHSMKR